ncbi:hypothetical protein K8Q98_01325 [Candidatus Nomurabacteria bacterium]|nr:hypothetical protein [Candidatus Nomurabacteria bacterium]
MRLKAEKVKIINISVSPVSLVFGLGDDGKVYYWDKEDETWRVHSDNLSLELNEDDLD